MSDNLAKTSGVMPIFNRRRWISVAAVAAVAVLAYNLVVWLPVANALGKDERNHGVGVHVYRTWIVHPRDITVDLVTFKDAAPIDLMRTLFQAAAIMKDRSFGRVTLARRGRAVFVMEGAAFQSLGSEFDAGQNSIYLIRTLPETLFLPNGQPAFGTWAGGWLGVLNRQMEDVNSFSEAWVSGEAPAHTVDHGIGL